MRVYVHCSKIIFLSLLLLSGTVLPAFAVPHFDFGPDFDILVIILALAVGIGIPALVAVIIRKCMLAYQPTYSAPIWQAIALTTVCFWLPFYLLDIIILPPFNTFSSYSGTSNTLLGWIMIVAFAASGSIAGYYWLRELKK
ncbi:MAG: hypothetical protein EOO61_23080 [Hymenobacter sp.]|nr:MAG: hypothetical protein EOO61_23080 [Hymenobacter sp.]